jgi:hypothetical protein
MTKRIFLAGVAGAGKSTTGKALADLIGCEALGYHVRVRIAPAKGWPTPPPLTPPSKWRLAATREEGRRSQCGGMGGIITGS